MIIDEPCGSTEVELETPALLLVVDQSAAMFEGIDALRAAHTAIINFAAEEVSGGLVLGVLHYPAWAGTGEISCDPGDYALSPGFATIPEETAEFDRLLEAAHERALSRNGGDAAVSARAAPLDVAFEAAVRELSDWLLDHPEQTGTIALVGTGSGGDACAPDGLEDLARQIEEAAFGTPPLRTHLIALGEGEGLDELSGLSSTTVLAPADGEEALGMALFAELGRIRDERACSFEIPAPENGETFDPRRVNLQIESIDGTELPLYAVEDSAGCNDAAWAWHYDDNENPLRIELCHESCALARTQLRARLTLLTGCVTNVLPKP